MLNISNNNIDNEISLEDYNSGKILFQKKNIHKVLNRILLLFLIILLIVFFLPWTQNVTGQGFVTTLKPGQRPQTIQSPIPGQIEKWFIQEGDYVKKGDTILKISEVKSDYFDEKLVQRTENQVTAKESSETAYKEKVKALRLQINALKNEQKLKLKQTKNKLLQAKLIVKSDSITLQAYQTNQVIADTRFNRILNLQKEGLKAVRDVEEKRIKLQEAQAKLISQENKLLESKNKVINAQIELGRINASYVDKLSEVRSKLQAAKSSQYGVQTEIYKLENQLANYSRRNSLLYIIAPQNGYINRALKGGIGETFKEGESVVSIMPADYHLAVETYIRPIDLPLMNIGGKVRVQFDGWPAIVFSGWEGISYGTYGAKIVAIENFISSNGMYRLLLAPDEEDYKWPSGIRVGSGAKTIALLNDVPVWYELWRQLNGFPPNFYTIKSQKQNYKYKQKPVKLTK